jgi:hypothetical protein
MVAAIEETLNEPIEELSEDPYPGTNVIAAAVGVKTERTLYRNSRCFDLQATSEGYTIEEWRREGWYHVAAKPLWKRTVAPDELKTLVLYLIHQTKGDSEFSRSVTRRRGARPKPTTKRSRQSKSGRRDVQ